MALNIKDPETDRLARELARLTGKSITIALREAIEERLTAIRGRQSVLAGPELSMIIERGRARVALDDRSADEIIGYDEHGLPS